jgi:hypothetical protein
MIAGVAGTHTALWHLFDDKRLSAAAEAFINEAATARRKIAISSISLAEVVYLIEKNRLPQSAYEELTQALADPEHVFCSCPDSHSPLYSAQVVGVKRCAQRRSVMSHGSRKGGSPDPESRSYNGSPFFVEGSRENESSSAQAKGHAQA